MTHEPIDAENPGTTPVPSNEESNTPEAPRPAPPLPTEDAAEASRREAAEREQLAAAEAYRARLREEQEQRAREEQHRAALAREEEARRIRAESDARVTRPVEPSAAGHSAYAPAPAQPTQAQPTQAQPTQAQPTQAQHNHFAAPSQPHAGHAPQPAPGQQHAAAPHYAGTAAYPAAQDHSATQPFGYDGGQGGVPPLDPGNAFSAPEQPRKRRGGMLLIAGVAVGALLGGGVGAYVTSAIMPTHSAVGQAGNAGSGAITINDKNNVNQIAAVAGKVLPSTVTITVTSAEGESTGSGSFITKDGYILTNNHVVTMGGATTDVSVRVQDSNGRLYKATVIGADPLNDLAVIKVEGKDFTPVEFADSDKLNVGEMAIALGAPRGLNDSVTNGIVSALNRSISLPSTEVPENDGSQTEPESPWGFDLPGKQQQQNTAQSSVPIGVIQTDAPINPGNSGGPLVDAEGKLIGVNVAIYHAGTDETAGSIGLGFAIPSNTAKRISDELIANGKATHGLLGATVADANNDPDATVVGATIKEVSPGGAAEKGGLRAGDLVTALNGKPVTNPSDLTAQVRSYAPDTEVEITFVRGGQAQTTKVTLGALSTK